MHESHEKGLHILEALANEPLLEYLDGSHPLRLEAARKVIEETAALISAKLGN